MTTLDERAGEAVAFLGLTVTVLWAHTAIRAHYLIEFWLAVLRDLESRTGLGEEGPEGRRTAYLSGSPVQLLSGV